MPSSPNTATGSLRNTGHGPGASAVTTSSPPSSARLTTGNLRPATTSIPMSLTLPTIRRPRCTCSGRPGSCCRSGNRIRAGGCWTRTATRSTPGARRSSRPLSSSRTSSRNCTAPTGTVSPCSTGAAGERAGDGGNPGWLAGDRPGRERRRSRASDGAGSVRGRRAGAVNGGDRQHSDQQHPERADADRRHGVGGGDGTRHPDVRVRQRHRLGAGHHELHRVVGGQRGRRAVHHPVVRVERVADRGRVIRPGVVGQRAGVLGAVQRPAGQRGVREHLPGGRRLGCGSRHPDLPDMSGYTPVGAELLYSCSQASTPVTTPTVTPGASMTPGLPPIAVPAGYMANSAGQRASALCLKIWGLLVATATVPTFGFGLYYTSAQPAVWSGSNTMVTSTSAIPTFTAGTYPFYAQWDIAYRTPDP